MSRRVSFYDSKVGILPAGKWLQRLSEVDARSKMGLRLMDKTLSRSGLVVLDAHTSPLDIFVTATALSEALSLEKMVMPVAGYVRRMPVVGGAINRFEEPDSGRWLMPVYRRKDWQRKDWLWLMRRVLLKQYSKEHAKWFNKHFINESERVVQRPGQVLLMAPYGGSPKMEVSVRKGVMRILRSGAPVGVSMSVFDWRNLCYRVKILPYLLKFDRFTSFDEINKSVKFGYRSLEAWKDRRMWVN